MLPKGNVKQNIPHKCDYCGKSIIIPTKIFGIYNLCSTKCLENYYIEIIVSSK